MSIIRLIPCRTLDIELVKKKISHNQGSSSGEYDRMNVKTENVAGVGGLTVG